MVTVDESRLIDMERAERERSAPLRPFLKLVDRVNTRFAGGKVCHATPGDEGAVEMGYALTSGPAQKVRVLMAALLIGTMAAIASAGNPELPFYENFEPLHGEHWNYTIEWEACDVPGHESCPDDPGLPLPVDPEDPDSRDWGPLKFETWPDVDNGGNVYSGQRSGRQVIADPYWYSIFHEFTPPAGDKELRLAAWWYDPADILCACDQGAQPSYYTCDCETIDENPPPRPNRQHFKVISWLFFSTPDRSEYFVLGVNSHESWDHYAWATKTDGWNVTSVPRTKGWHRLEIVVQPYTGNAGDVEFWLDGALVAQGTRAAGGGTGADVTWLRLGGDPAVTPESHLTNTFEQFWFDEISLTACNNPRADFDGDGDVDQNDFALFQRCITGPGDPFTFNEDFDGANCQCADINGDKDVDADDYDAFFACVSGPNIPADDTCDDGIVTP